MEFTINVHVTGMDKLAEAILSLLDKPELKTEAAVAVPVAAPATAPAPNVPVSAPAPVQPTPAPTAIPTQTAPVASHAAYTFEQLQAAAGGLVALGKQADLLVLLGQFGVQAMTQLQQEQFGNFATALRGLGAKI